MTAQVDWISVDDVAADVTVVDEDGPLDGDVTAGAICWRIAYSNNRRWITRALNDAT